MVSMGSLGFDSTDRGALYAFARRGICRRAWNSGSNGQGSRRYQISGEAPMAIPEEQAVSWIGGVPMGRFKIELVRQVEGADRQSPDLKVICRSSTEGRKASNLISAGRMTLS